MKYFTCIFHDDAEDVNVVVEEGLFVGNDGWWLDGGENSDFVECVFLLFDRELIHFNFFQGVDEVIASPLYLVDSAVGSFS